MAILNFLAIAQETNPQPPVTDKNAPVSYEKRVEHGFGQLREPRFAGDKPEWLKQEEADKRIHRSEVKIITESPNGKPMFRGQGRQFRGEFRGRQNDCPFCNVCEKHKQMMKMSRNHAANGKQYRGGRGGPGNGPRQFNR